MAKEDDSNKREFIVKIDGKTDIDVGVTIGNLTQADAELWGKLRDGSHTSRMGVIWDNNGIIRVRRSEYPYLSRLMLHFTAVNDPNNPEHQMLLSGALFQSDKMVSESSCDFRGTFASIIETRTITWSFAHEE